MSVPKNSLGLWVTDTSKVLGNLHAIQAMGFDRLIVRTVIHDHVPHAVPYQAGNLAKLLTDAARVGIAVDAWGYGYPSGVPQQVSAIGAILNAHPSIQNFVGDFEVEFEKVDGTVADSFMHDLAVATNHRVALHLSSFCNPSEHPLPYKSFLNHCESFMPQAYRIPPTTVETVMHRTTTECPALAAHSLGGELIATVNRPEMLQAVAEAGPTVFSAANVWVWDGSGTDIGVHGHEADWAHAIASYKAAFK